MADQAQAPSPPPAELIAWRAAGRPIEPGRKSAYFVIYRQVPRGFARTWSKRSPMPRFRHPTLEEAKAEAQRLLGKHPESTFVILQEVATVVSAGDAA